MLSWCSEYILKQDGIFGSAVIAGLYTIIKNNVKKINSTCSNK